MDTTIAQDVAGIPRITRDTDAREVATAAYDRLLDLLARLEPGEWSARVPDCPDWTVADVVGHMIGAARGHASLLEMMRQLSYGARHKTEFDGNDLDATNDLQIREHADLVPVERLAALREVAPKAVAGRMRTPGLVRRVKVPLASGGSTAAGMPDKLQLGNLFDAILTRDVWLHRIDIARAVGRQVDVDSDADRRIVADVVVEWAERHGRPFQLTLTGPAGGRFRQGSGGDVIELDAVEFCRVLSGRAPAEGLLATRVLF